VVFRYAPGRGKAHAEALLAGYRDTLQCDGYAAYKRLAVPAGGGDGATLVFCWSHVRRGFVDSVKSKAAPNAEKALRRVAALCAVNSPLRKPPLSRSGLARC
jgi:transposase